MLTTLVAASIGGAVLAAIVWAIVRLAPALSPAARTMLWWCAAAKFVVALLWVSPIEVPVLPAPSAPAGGQVLNYQIFQDSRPDPSPTTGQVVKKVTVQDLTPGIWAAGVLLSCLLGLRRLGRILRASRRSSPAPPDVQSMALELAARLGIRRTPPIRASADVATPLVVGLRRPVILVPATRFFELPEHRQRMAICHELAHIRRRDLWLGCVPAIAERLFFFHPLAHLAAREYAFWREAACDAAVLEALDAAPQEYGRLLLDLGVSRPRTTLAAAGAPWSFPNLKRRITMLRDPSSRTRGSRTVAALAIGGAILLVAPLQLTARHAGVPGARSGRTGVEAGVKAAAPSSPAPATGAQPAPARPATAEPPEGPRKAQAARPAKEARTAQADAPRSRFSYVVFSNDGHDEGIHMSGSQEDVARARQVRKPGEQMVWIRDGDREYVVRDPSVVQRITQIWKPLGEIGTAQGRIGGEQGKLGTRQAEIGVKQAAIGAEQARIGAQQGAIGARQAQVALREAEASLREGQQDHAAKRAELEKERRQIESEMRKLDLEMRALGDRMRELERPMHDLSAEMNVLSQQMERLGEQMREAARKAQIETHELFDRLISSGAAQIVK